MLTAAHPVVALSIPAAASSRQRGFWTPNQSPCCFSTVTAVHKTSATMNDSVTALVLGSGVVLPCSARLPQALTCVCVRSEKVMCVVQKQQLAVLCSCVGPAAALPALILLGFDFPGQSCWVCSSSLTELLCSACPRCGEQTSSCEFGLAACRCRSCEQHPPRMSSSAVCVYTALSAAALASRVTTSVFSKRCVSAGMISWHDDFFASLKPVFHLNFVVLVCRLVSWLWQLRRCRQLVT